MAGPDKSSPMFYFEDWARSPHLPWRSTIMHATMPLLVSLLVTPPLAQAAQSAPSQPVAWHPCARIAAACTQAGFSQRNQQGSWDHVRLYPTNYVRDATTRAGHQAFAANRPAGCGGVQ